MNTGIPNLKRKIIYDLPSKFVECCRDIPYVSARVLSSDTGNILKGVLVLAEYVHLCIKTGIRSNLGLPTLNVALRAIRVTLDPCFKYLHAELQKFLNKNSQRFPALTLQIGLVLGLGAIHLSLFTYLTVERCKKLMKLYSTLTGNTYEETKGGKVYTKDIRVKLASIGLKLASIAATFVGIGLMAAGTAGWFGLGAGAIQVANLCWAGGTAAGTASWAGLLVWKHFTYNPRDLGPSSPPEGGRGNPNMGQFLM